MSISPLFRWPNSVNHFTPSKDALLPRITAGSTQFLFEHESFAVVCLLALLHHASYPILVHRLTGSFHACSPRSVALTQLHFLSLAVVSSWEGFYLQERAHAGPPLPPRSEGRRFTAHEVSGAFIYLMYLVEQAVQAGVLSLRHALHIFCLV